VHRVYYTTIATTTAVVTLAVAHTVGHDYRDRTRPSVLVGSSLSSLFVRTAAPRPQGPSLGHRANSGDAEIIVSSEIPSDKVYRRTCVCVCV